MFILLLFQQSMCVCWERDKDRFYSSKQNLYDLRPCWISPPESELKFNMRPDFQMHCKYWSSNKNQSAFRTQSNKSMHSWSGCEIFFYICFGFFFVKYLILETLAVCILQNLKDNSVWITKDVDLTTVFIQNSYLIIYML